jgi:hypothetical protein
VAGRSPSLENSGVLVDLKVSQGAQAECAVLNGRMFDAVTAKGAGVIPQVVPGYDNHARAYRLTP